MICEEFRERQPVICRCEQDRSRDRCATVGAGPRRAQRAAVEAQIPTEVLRQDPSRSPVHHEGGAGKAALPIPRRHVSLCQVRNKTQ